MPAPRYPFSLSVIVPVFNDAETLVELHRRLQAVLPHLTSRYEIIFIDDGSTDRSLEVLRNLSAPPATIKIVQLIRNFGQPSATAAGLDLSNGEVVVLMDSDLQDRPEDIEKLLEVLERDQVMMAIARWSDRKDNVLRIAASRLFNFLANRITNVPHLPRARAFRALRREAVEALKALPEKTATPLNLLCWMGYRYSVVDLVRDERYAGASGYTFSRVLQLSLNRVFSHSLLPIRLASYLGFLLIIGSLLTAAYLLIQSLSADSTIPGLVLFLDLILFLLGWNFLFLGILGEYLGRIYTEVRHRPKYIIKKIYTQTAGE